MPIMIRVQIFQDEKWNYLIYMDNDPNWIEQTYQTMMKSGKAKFRGLKYAFKNKEVEAHVKRIMGKDYGKKPFIIYREERFDLSEAEAAEIRTYLRSVGFSTRKDDCDWEDLPKSWLFKEEFLVKASEDYTNIIYKGVSIAHNIKIEGIKKLLNNIGECEQRLRRGLVEVKDLNNNVR